MNLISISLLISFTHAIQGPMERGFEDKDCSTGTNYVAFNLNQKQHNTQKRDFSTTISQMKNPTIMRRTVGNLRDDISSTESHINEMKIKYTLPQGTKSNLAYLSKSPQFEAERSTEEARNHEETDDEDEEVISIKSNQFSEVLYSFFFNLINYNFDFKMTFVIGAVLFIGSISIISFLLCFYFGFVCFRYRRKSRSLNRDSGLKSNVVQIPEKVYIS